VRKKGNMRLRVKDGIVSEKEKGESEGAERVRGGKLKALTQYVLR